MSILFMLILFHRSCVIHWWICDRPTPKQIIQMWPSVLDMFCAPYTQNLHGCGFWLIESRSKEGGVCCKLALGTPVVHKRLAKMDLTSIGTSKWQDDSLNFAWTTNILHLSRGSFPRKAVNHWISIASGCWLQCIHSSACLRHLVSRLWHSWPSSATAHVPQRQAAWPRNSCRDITFPWNLVKEHHVGIQIDSHLQLLGRLDEITSAVQVK